MDNKRRAFSDIRQEDAAEIWRYPLTDNARNAILDVWQKVYKIKRPEPPKKVKPIRPDYFFSYGSFQVLFLLVVVYFHPTFKGSVGMTIMIVTIWTFILYRLIVALRYFISFWVIENQVTDDGRRAIQLSIQKKGYDLSIDEYVVLQVSHPHLLRLWTDFEFASKPTRIILSLVPIAIEIILVILGYTMTAISLFICMVYYSYHEKKFMPQMTAFIESLN